MPQECSTCVFYSPIDGYTGSCRRNAPRWDAFSLCQWPVVDRSSFCGEYKTRNKTRIKLKKEPMDALTKSLVGAMR